MHQGPWWKGRLGFGLAAALIFLLAVGAWAGIRSLRADNTPHSWNLDGTMLVITNSEEAPLWRKSFPDGFWKSYYDRGVARAWFGDLDGDHHTEVLFLYHPAVDPAGHSTTLICYSDSGKEKWRWTPGRVLPELEGIPEAYHTAEIAVLKGANGGANRVVVSSLEEPYFPSQIAILDANGKLQSEYWHSGHLDYIALADLDGNGKEEIIATGKANGYHQATLVVLDPDHLSGASLEPLRPDLQLHGFGVPHERLRILFARSDFNRAQYAYNWALRPNIGKDIIQVTIEEGYHGRIARFCMNSTRSSGCSLRTPRISSEVGTQGSTRRQRAPIASVRAKKNPSGRFAA